MDTVIFMVDLVFAGTIALFTWGFISSVVDLYELL